MILKTIIFILLLYYLVKVISRLFLPSSGNRQSNARFFYQVFKNVREQQKQQARQNSSDDNNKKHRFEEIEEAEYEDVTEDEPKSSDS